MVSFSPSRPLLPASRYSSRQTSSIRIFGSSSSSSTITVSASVSTSCHVSRDGFPQPCTTNGRIVHSAIAYVKNLRCSANFFFSVCIVLSLFRRNFHQPVFFVVYEKIYNFLSFENQKTGQESCSRPALLIHDNRMLAERAFYCIAIAFSISAFTRSLKASSHSFSLG
jgi:hypothetical protein